MLFPPDDTAHPLGRDFQDFIRDRPSGGWAVPDNEARPARRLGRRGHSGRDARGCLRRGQQGALR